MGAVILRAEHLGMVFPSESGENRALKDIELTLWEKEFVCIVGPSGSGKSTLLRILAGVLEQSSGSISYPSGEAFTRSIVFQDSNLMPWMNTLENIALPLLIQGMPRRQALVQAHQWLKRIGLEGFEKEWPRNLSGGMAQRVALARALIQEPRLLLLDEPFGALDAMTREQISVELLHTWEQLDNTVLMVTHSISEAILLSDRVLVYSERPGRIVDEMSIPFSHPRDPDLRDTPAFLSLSKTLRKKVMSQGK